MTGLVDHLIRLAITIALLSLAGVAFGYLMQAALHGGL